MSGIYETLRGLSRGDVSVLWEQMSFYRFEYRIPGAPDSTRVGVSAWPDWFGEAGKPEPEIAKEIYTHEHYQGTPWNQILDASDKTREDGTFTVYIDIENWQRPEAQNVRNAFTRALQDHGCWEHEDSANPKLWTPEE